MANVLTVGDVLARTSRLYPRRVAIRDDRRSLTYADLEKRAFRVAHLLRAELQLSEGSRFLLLAPNCVEYAEIYFGAALAGCTCVPVNPRLTAREASVIAADAGAEALLSDPGLADAVLGVVSHGFDGRIVWLDGAGEEKPGEGHYERLLGQASSARVRGVPADDATPFLQIYTSGTTGSPKGAMISHRNLVANAWSVLAAGGSIEGDVLALTSPMSHVSAGARVISSTHAAATLHVMAAFDAERIVSLICAGELTTGLFVPAMVQALVDAADPNLVRSGRFRRFIYGTAPMPQPLLERAVDVFGCEFQQGYGLTETTGHATVLAPSDHLIGPTSGSAPHLGSVGRQAHGVLIRCAADDGLDVPSGDTGEVLVRGPNVTEGYWNRPEDTARALRDGWLHTGDVGVIDDQGYLTLVDRKSDMLVSGGFNVYPQEIEIQLREYPGIAEVAVVGRSDARWGEVPIAFVVVRPEADDETLSPQHLEAWCRERLAGYKVPRHYRFVSELPRNHVGKVLKRNLREEAERS